MHERFFDADTMKVSLAGCFGFAASIVPTQSQLQWLIAAGSFVYIILKCLNLLGLLPRRKAPDDDNNNSGATPVTP